MYEMSVKQQYNTNMLFKYRKLNEGNKMSIKIQMIHGKTDETTHTGCFCRFSRRKRF